MDLTVRFRDCSCPGTPHADGDTVTFRPQLEFDDYAKALGLIFNGEALAQNAFPIYLRKGPVSWNLVSEDGAVPLTEDAIEGLDFADKYLIANHGDSLYAGTVLSPLVRLTSSPSVTGPTTDSSKPRSKR